ncbi:MAG: thioredoxin fold domain-containing protein [Actinobacteria bacterium]|nr:thioredoxin fold domain-containing protein [Actinomycetota bacterium]
MRRARTVFFIFTLIFLALSLSGCGEKQLKSKINWIDYSTAIAEAKQEKKPIFIDFFTEWCFYCKKMDKETFSDPKVIEYMNNNFKSVKIDAESNENVVHQGKIFTKKELAKEYSVSGYPTLWFLDSKGNKVAPQTGFVDAQGLLYILEYVKSGSYKSMNFQDFINSKADK